MLWSSCNFLLDMLVLQWITPHLWRNFPRGTPTHFANRHPPPLTNISDAGSNPNSNLCLVNAGHKMCTAGVGKRSFEPSCMLALMLFSYKESGTRHLALLSICPTLLGFVLRSYVVWRCTLMCCETNKKKKH